MKQTRVACRLAAFASTVQRIDLDEECEAHPLSPSPRTMLKIAESRRGFTSEQLNALRTKLYIEDLRASYGYHTDFWRHIRTVNTVAFVEGRSPEDGYARIAQGVFEKLGFAAHPEPAAPIPVDDVWFWLDTETGGFAGQTHALLELAATATQGRDGMALGRFHSLVFPDGDIAEQARVVSGYEAKKWKNAPDLQDAISNFFFWCAGYNAGTMFRIAGWNVPFDQRFCRDICYRTGLRDFAERFDQAQAFDALKEHRAELPKGEGKLERAAAYVGVPAVGSHTAEGDVWTARSTHFALMEARKARYAVLL